VTAGSDPSAHLPAYLLVSFSGLSSLWGHAWGLISCHECWCLAQSVQQPCCMHAALPSTLPPSVSGANYKLQATQRHSLSLPVPCLFPA
jgi:hypothetical protein